MNDCRDVPANLFLPEISHFKGKIMWYRLLFSCVLAIFLSTQAFAQEEHIYLLLGQSNMAGDSGHDSQDQVNHPRVQMLGFNNQSGTSFNVWHNFNLAPMHHEGTGVSPGNTFGRCMADANPNVTIRLVPLAIPGAPIELFQKGVPRPGNFFLPPDNNWSGGYAWMQNRINAALNNSNGVIKGILFLQGESNASQSDWPEKAAGVINDLKSDYNTGNIPVLIGELRSDTFASHNAQQIPEMRNRINNAHIISSAGLTPANDDFHFSRQAYRDYGYRFAYTMKQQVPATSNNNSITGTKRLRDAWQGRYFMDSQSSFVQNAPLMPTWDGQKWSIEFVSDNIYRLRNNQTGDYLGAISPLEWDDLYTYPLDPGFWSQQWHIHPADGGRFRLQNRWTGLYISSPEFPWERMRQAVLRDSWNSQRFSLETP